MNKRILAVIVILIVVLVLILAMAIYPSNIKKLIYGEDYFRTTYYVNISSNETNIDYILKVPTPSNWTIINDLDSTSGNINFTETTEMKIIQTNNGSVEREIDYLLIQGNGNTSLSFIFDSDEIDRNFIPYNSPNHTLEIYKETVSENGELLLYMYHSRESKSPSGVSIECGVMDWVYSPLIQNGWQKIESQNVGW